MVIQVCFVLCHTLEFYFLIMIYLFGSGAWDSDKKVLKIGYSSKQDERETAYLLHNPLGKFLAWREGEKDLELKLHLALVDCKEDFLEEWFYDEDLVLERFGWPIEKLNKYLWDNREDLFFNPFIPSQGTLKRKIYDELFSLYGGNNSVIQGTKTLSEREDI